MVAFALILLVLVAVLVVAIVVSNPQIYDLSIFGAVIPVNSTGIFITGAIAMAVAILALLLLRSGIRRARLRHRQLKALEASSDNVASEKRRARSDEADGLAENSRAEPSTSDRPADTQKPRHPRPPGPRHRPRQSTRRRHGRSRRWIWTANPPRPLLPSGGRCSKKRTS